MGGSGPVNEALIETALDCGALGAKLAGAGRGGTIIALHPNPEEMIAALRQAGATRIMIPKPMTGVRVVRTDGEQGDKGNEKYKMQSEK
ncbi:MAG: hypothetical protein V1800_17450 [Candidatus Latescibacterota bacterium]